MVIQLNDLVTVRLTLSCSEQYEQDGSKADRNTRYKTTHIRNQPPAGYFSYNIVELHHSIIQNVNSWQMVAFSHLAHFFHPPPAHTHTFCSHTCGSHIYRNFFSQAILTELVFE